jgi:hypothetical protein
MKSARSVDPTDPLVKQLKSITSKVSKKRTDDDLKQMDRIEFELGLYHNGATPFIPDVNLVGVIREGGRINRRGREINAGIDVLETEVPLQYDGPRDVQGLYDKRFADRRVIRNKGAGGAVMRTRPKFPAWGITFTVAVDDNVVSPDVVKEALDNAGARVGLGDFRPRFGRFEVVSWRKA